MIEVKGDGRYVEPMPPLDTVAAKNVFGPTCSRPCKLNAMGQTRNSSFGLYLQRFCVIRK